MLGLYSIWLWQLYFVGAGVPMVNVQPATPQYPPSLGGTYSHDAKLDIPQEADGIASIIQFLLIWYLGC